MAIALATFAALILLLLETKINLRNGLEAAHRIPKMGSVSKLRGSENKALGRI